MKDEGFFSWLGRFDVPVQIAIVSGFVTVLVCLIKVAGAITIKVLQYKHEKQVLMLNINHQESTKITKLNLINGGQK